MRIRKQKSLIDRAQDYVETVAETVIPQLEAALEAARDKAGPAIADAREKAAPMLAEGRAIAAERASAGAAAAREQVVPVIAEGKALAAEMAAAGAAAAAEKAAASRDFAAAKVAELRQEPEPKGSKWKKVLFVGGLLAIGGAVFSRLRQQSAGSNNWQSSYVPTPPPTPASPATPAAPATAAAPTNPETTATPATPADASPESTDDIAGSDPGEAISDAAETPHEVTTPDAPAEVIDVDDVPENKG